jgi:pimeloyl-ACP methyl ester carboxylesterase
MASAEDCKMLFHDLPLARLHVLEVGSGPVLIIVPATISECKDWIPLTRFMAHWFHVYFFELPGHGESTPFHAPFSTDLVAQTVEQLLDACGIDRFSVMGFSFGGILAMKTFKRLSSRVENLIFISPCLTKRSLLLPRTRILAAQAVIHLINRPRIRRVFLQFLHNPRTVNTSFRFLKQISQLESTIELRPKLLTISETTLEVLARQVDEITTVDFPIPAERHTAPCYLWMSVNDPVLDFATTLNAVQAHFENVDVVPSDIPFHQPPEPLTYEGLMRDYHQTVGAFLQKPPGRVAGRKPGSWELHH